MVEAKLIMTPPFSLYVLKRGVGANGIVALSRDNTGSILYVKSTDANEY